MDAYLSDFLQVANSYFGLLGQAPASHHDRARLANVVRDHGHAVNKALTKTYRGALNRSIPRQVHGTYTSEKVGHDQ